MFQFRRFPTCTYLIQCRLTGSSPAGLPHSEISGSKLICSSPKLIAAYHVFHRLLMPRHSPCALNSLTSSPQTLCSALTFSRLTFFLESTYLLVLFIEKVFELCRLKIGYFVVCVTLYLKVSTIKMLPLCCLLAILNYYLIVQFSRCSFLNPSSRIQISTFSVY